MELFHILSGVVSLSAILAFLNQRYLKLPAGIALMLAGLLISLLVQAIGALSPAFQAVIVQNLETINFSEIVLDFMLSFLLFAGALHTDYTKLKEARGPILTFASFGVIFSTFLVGTGAYGLLFAIGQPVDYVYCLLFGALITPTDPVAVMGILKKAGVPKKVETTIVGESLFNDGVGVVVFLLLLEIATLGIDQLSGVEIAKLVGFEIGGGLGLGLLLGWAGFKIMKRIDHYPTEVMITLAIVMGGYSAAYYLHFSGPLAMVAAGLLIGNTGHKGAMSDITADYIHKFWEMLDEILNAILFVLIGLELLLVPFEWNYLWIGFVIILIVVGSRYIALATPTRLFGFLKDYPKGTLQVMTWGGLRGGISIALALSLSPEMARDFWVPITYTVVIFSLLVQGLTVERVARNLR
ncbi:MAG: sodium:proton antiporter [Bacteroidota bacterium]